MLSLADVGEEAPLNVEDDQIVGGRDGVEEQQGLETTVNTREDLEGEEEDEPSRLLSRRSHQPHRFEQQVLH